MKWLPAAMARVYCWHSMVPGWDATVTGLTAPGCHWYPFVYPGGERQYEVSVIFHWLSETK